jgi:hypothetical protein
LGRISRKLTNNPTKQQRKDTVTIKFAFALFGSGAAFAPTSSVQKSTSLNAFVAEELPGVLAPVELFDPLSFAEKADEATVKRHREAELTHGRVAMLASVGCLVGEKLSGLRSSLALPSTTFLRFLLDSGLPSPL